MLNDGLIIIAELIYGFKMPMKITLKVSVYEHEGRPMVGHEIEEDDATMKDVALLIYKMKQIEQELLDRIWDDGGEGFEIESN